MILPVGWGLVLWRKLAAGIIKAVFCRYIYNYDKMLLSEGLPTR